VGSSEGKKSSRVTRKARCKVLVSTDMLLHYYPEYDASRVIELREGIEIVLSSFTAKSSAAIRLVVLGRHPQNEAAEMTGLTRGSVTRAMGRFRREFKEWLNA